MSTLSFFARQASTLASDARYALSPNLICLDAACREYYTEQHFWNLVRYEAVHLVQPHRMERCVDVHGHNCTYGCRSCHSCRQCPLVDSPLLGTATTKRHHNARAQTQLLLAAY